MKAVACAGLCLVAGNACAAEWVFAPSLQLATTYVDNPRLLADGGTSSAGALGEISARFQRRTERLDLLLLPRLNSVRSQDDESLESDNRYLDARLNYMTERSQWQVSAGYVRDTTLASELESTGLVESSRQHEAINVSGGPTWLLTERVNLSLQGSVLDSRYPDAGNSGLVDYQYRLASAAAGIAATERSTVQITLQGGELVVPEFDSRTRDATVRLQWEFKSGGMWTTTLSAGPAYVDARFAQDSGAVFDASAERRDERWTVRAHAGRSLSPTGRGVLAKRDRTALNVSRRLTTTVTGAVALSWTRNEDLLQQPGVAYEQVEYARVDLNLSWRFSEHWSLALGVGGATSDNRRTQNEAENYRASLGIVWNGQQRTL